MMKEAIHVSNVVKYFNVPDGYFLIFPKWRKKKVIKGISFSVKKGEFVGLLGPNGSGKTTLTKILSGILTPEEGEARVNGFIPWKREKAFLSSIGVVFGNRTNLIFDVPLRDSFEFLRDVYGLSDSTFRKRLERLSYLLGISSLLSTPVRKLSFGQRMRAEVLSAFLHKPSVVFLDEPMIGLDPAVRERVRKFLRHINRKEETTIVLTTHALEDVDRLCERALLIKEGTLLYDGSLSKLKERANYKHVELVSKHAKEIAKLFSFRSEGNRAYGTLPLSKEKAFLRALSKFEIDKLTMREPSLEEIILSLYK